MDSSQYTNTYVPNQFDKWIVDNFEQSIIVAAVLFWLSQSLFIFLIWKNILRCKEVPINRTLKVSFQIISVLLNLYQDSFMIQTPSCYRPDALLDTQPTVSEHWGLVWWWCWWWRFDWNFACLAAPVVTNISIIFTI